MIVWQTAFFSCTSSEIVGAQWQNALTACGYSPFDPFGDRFIRPAPRNVRLFLTPPQNSIGRAVGESDTEILRVLSHTFPIVYLTLEGDRASVESYQNGESTNGDWEAAAGLFPSSESNIAPMSAFPSTTIGGLPDDLIPESVRGKMGGINAKQAESMIGRWMNTVNKHDGINANDADNARALLASRPQWDSEDGQRIASWVRRIGLAHPANTPDFVTLRDAYALYRRRQRQPDAPLYPGDAEALATVPNPETYIPLFGGKA